MLPPAGFGRVGVAPELLSQDVRREAPSASYETSEDEQGFASDTYMTERLWVWTSIEADRAPRDHEMRRSPERSPIRVLLKAVLVGVGLVAIALVMIFHHSHAE